MASEKSLQPSYCIYMHRNKQNGKIYIGQTCQELNQRWRNGEGYKNNDYFYRAIQKYGWDGFEHIVLYDNLSLDEANQKEIELIAEYHTANPQYGYNLRNGGSNGALSAETIEKIRQSNLGKKRSSETCRKNSEAHKGNKWNEATRAHRMATMPRGFDHSRSKPVMCIETGEAYGSSGEAERACPGAYSRGIRAACTGAKGQKTCGGYHWRFLTKEEVEYYGGHRQ